MIPSVVEAELRETIIDYLKTTFSFQDESVTRALEEFLRHDDEGIFKGPFIQLRLPYRPAGGTEVDDLLDIRPPFIPYVHQVTAFGRLTTKGNEPLPTIVTTGTGSGKTECFLFPLLDHCFREIGKPGIKAIVLYPMNALAEDQAGRFAEEIWRDDRLRGKVTAGMYVGGKGRDRTMGQHNVITDRDVLRLHPPDILLTNYKMLDFLMLRPEDQKLWRETPPGATRYLILDELHTYDGAQGSDVACLIRRLRVKLRSDDRSLCCVGTSATLAGEQATAVSDLLAFATKIFGVAFKRDGVVTEERLEMSEYLGEEIAFDTLPKDIKALRPRSGDTLESYIGRQSAAWFGMSDPDPVELSTKLARHGFLRTLILNIQGRILEWDELIENTARWDDDFAGLAPHDRTAVLSSILALVSHARRAVAGRTGPFLYLQVQLWIREMSRLVREIAKEPGFFWRDKVPIDDRPRGLPAVYCRECGYSGWMGVQKKQDIRVTADPKTIYDAYFERSRSICYFFPEAAADPEDLVRDFLCTGCLAAGTDATCPHCKSECVPVKVSHKSSKDKYPRDLQYCPSCETDFALSVVGSQAASLSSVAISHLYLSRYNREKKLIAFTDSVQDASHRAGFFGARTYRFNLRTAMQSALEADDTGVIRLNEFTDRLLKHWGRTMSPQELVAAFLPRDLQELPAYRELLEHPDRGLNEKLREVLHRRLSWEVVMEYGFSVRVGRTLEKVRCSTTRIDGKRLAGALEQLEVRLSNEIAPLKGVTPSRLRHFVRGLLERTRVRGGISHLMLARYAEEKGKWFFLSKKMNPYMSSFGPDSRLPRLLSLDPNENVFDSCVTTGSAPTWYLDWVRRSLHPSLDVDLANEVYRTAARTLEDTGLLERLGKKNRSVYSIPQEALLVTRWAAGLRSRDDGHDQTVAEDEVEHWEGMPSLAYRGRGTYARETHRDQSYYRDVYRSGNVKRIFCSEHSGLLDRETRELVEDLFRSGRVADAPNLLTCTPTLELGIDIGDLSSTMLCSIPPTPTNYLQRIGRAGRNTGNSLILALAVVKPHDLYFFDNPLEMVSGMVHPPGCYLDAPEMLKRQFLAFCLDSWATEIDDVQRMPNRVVHLLAQNRKGGFPQSFLKYVARQRSELTSGFLALFEKYLSEDNRARLEEYAGSDAIAREINDCLERTGKEVDDLRRRLDRLKKHRNRIEAEPKKYDDPEKAIKDLNREMLAVRGLIGKIQTKYPLNLFTDEGLLPNYAFPESGVKLRSIVYGIPPAPGAPGNGRESTSETHEYVRGAREAIRDLAPFNTFYAESRKMQIDQVETGGRGQPRIAVWRFCSACAHMELDATGAARRTCPSCGSAGWEDTGQKHALLRMEQVSSRSSHSRSHTGDESDDREMRRYVLKDFIDIDPENWKGGFADEEGSFGFEFLNQVTLREVNFGLLEGRNGKFTANGQKLPEKGFDVCPDCGVVRDPLKDEARSEHRYWCYYNQGDRKKEWCSIFLYREVQSEAIRILLPFSTYEADTRLATFRACLELGLRRRFRGNPIHLVIRTQKDPGRGSDGATRNFLILYDSVPGGSGYLKEFAKSPESFRQILEEAAATLKSCSCRQRPDLKACYRCLYAYSRQYQLEALSRELGIEMISGILSRWEKLRAVETLSTIDLSADLIESELEERFRDVLGAHLQRRNLPWKKVLLSGKACYEFELGGRTWILEPQVPLGPKDNVESPCRPDFLLRPLRDERGVLPVAVFTDGFAYHVQPEMPLARVADDVEKRLSVLRSGRFLVWSLSWDDVEEFETDERAAGVSLFGDLELQPKLGALLKKLGSPLPREFAGWSAMASLVGYLKAPDRSSWRRAVAGAAFIAMRPQDGCADCNEIHRVAEALRTQVSLGADAQTMGAPGSDDSAPGWFGKVHIRTDVTLVVAAPRDAADSLDAERMIALLRLEDLQERRQATDYKDLWRKFLATANLLQFLPGFEWVTAEGVRQRRPETVTEQAVRVLEKPAQQFVARSEGDLSEEAAELLEIADPSVAPLVRACAQQGLALPELPCELADEHGTVCGQCELGWSDRRIAVFVPADEEERQEFESREWRVFRAEELAEDPTPLFDLIKGENQ